MLAQLGDLTRTPADLATPEYMVMRKFKRYEVRRRGCKQTPDCRRRRSCPSVSVSQAFRFRRWDVHVCA